MAKYRYFFRIGYKGTNYRGWQRQINAVSVQECLESILSKFLKEKIHCIGCGRTDAGVHASQYFFHIDTSQNIDPNLLFAINRMLPADLSIYEYGLAPKNWHAQHSASSRTYNYFIHTIKNPYLNDISALYSIQTDVKRMQKAANLLLGEKDFRAFCKTPDRHNHTLCLIEKAQWYSNKDKSMLRFEIKANRFLKGMIRILVNQMLEVGTQHLSLEAFANQLNQKITPSPLKLAYPQGLYLTEINYPDLNILSPGIHFLPLDLIEWHTLDTKD